MSWPVRHEVKRTYSICMDSDCVRKNYIHRRERPLNMGRTPGYPLWTIRRHLIITRTVHATTNRSDQKAGLALVRSCSKYAWNQVPASGAGLRESDWPQWKSYRVALWSLVPSDSPPGLTQTKASSTSRPVSEVGRRPNPVPLSRLS